MNLILIAGRNIGRNKVRSILSALAVAMACALLIFMMAFQQGSYIDWINNSLRARTGHFQLQHPAYFVDKDMSAYIEEPEKLMAILVDVKHVEGMAPRVNAPALIGKGQRSFGVMIYGIDPTREKKASTLPAVVRKGAYLEQNDLDGILLSKTLARNLGAGLNDSVVFFGQGADGSIAAGTLIVRGIFSFGIKEFDSTVAFAHIGTIRDAYAVHGGASEIAVLLDSDVSRQEAIRQTTRILETHSMTNIAVLGWPELMPGVEQGIKMDWNSGLIMYAVLVLIVGFGIANTFLMAFMERIHEYGVLLSLGMKPRILGIMAYLESVILLAIGLVAGIAIGVPLTLFYGRKGLDFSRYEDLFVEYGLDPILHPYLNEKAIGWALGLVAGITLFVAIYPAVKASRLKPIEALRHG